MSYINDALKKAQKDKDNRYERFGEVISKSQSGLNRPRKRWFIACATVAVGVLIIVVAVLAVRGMWQPETRQKQTSTPRATVAEKQSAKAAETAPGTSEGPAVGEADIRYQEALTVQRGGNLRQAETLYEDVLKIDPGHVRSLNNLGVIYMGQKRREKAIAVFGRAVVLKKDYVDPYYNLACLYAQAGEIDESLWYLKVAAAIDRGVIEWVKKDADMKNVAASPEFKKIMGGQKN